MNNIKDKILVLGRQIYGQLKEDFTWPPNWKRIGAYAIVALGGGTMLVYFTAILVFHGIFGGLPSYAELRSIRNSTASEVYAADGALLGRYFIQNRVNADLEEISPFLINALIATEDARFTQHRGVDLRALLRVLVKSILLSNDAAGGGSTLSQQLAKNLYPRQHYGRISMVVNKFKEMFIARRLEKLYTKEELLALYLNTVPFSDNIYGVKVAAQRFFGKSPNNLRMEEAAVLVGMLKGTSLFHPVRHPERSLQRRNVVLHQMSKYGYLSPVEADSLSALPMKLDYSVDSSTEGLATYFRESLRQELEEIVSELRKPDGTPYNLYSDGLRIYTTIDSRLQRYAEQSMREHMPKLQGQFDREWRRGDPWGSKDILNLMVRNTPRYKDLKQRGFSEREIEKIFATPLKMSVFNWKTGSEEREMTPLDSVKYYLRLLNTGFLAMEPATGAIKAWIGGIDFGYIQYDHVKSKRQVGSTFKPIVYAEALEQGFDPCQLFPNELRTYEEYEGWTPENADGAYGGYYSMEGALTNSVNTVSVQIVMETGTGPVRSLARRMGVKGNIPNGPSLALGTAEASLLEMVQVFATLANHGLRPEPFYLDRIETADGQVLKRFSPPRPREQALSPESADIMVQMLKGVVNNGTASRLRWQYGLGNIDLAGKTGTSQNQSDGWFIGMTPTLVAGAWVGAETPAVHFRSLSLGQGANTALPIFGGFLRRAVGDRKFSDLRNRRFTALPDSVLALMECPDFVHPDSTGFDSLLQTVEDVGFFQRLQQELGLEEELPVKVKPRRDNEADSNYVDRMIRYNERLQRRDERKEQWSKLLFGKMKEEQAKKEREKQGNNFE